MKRTIVNLLCGAVLCAVALPASGLAVTKNSSRPKTPKIDQREHNQQSRIRQGVNSGELTRHETLRLEKEEGRIKANELRAKSDGRVTAAERDRLEKELNKTSHDIYEQKHDDQVQH